MAFQLTYGFLEFEVLSDEASDNPLELFDERSGRIG
jgi:hypothetical protein